MNDSESSQFEVHDRDVLEKARSILSETESPRMWAQAVVEAVRKNGTSVWYLLATNEGHGFSSTRTIHFALCVQVFFATKVLSG